MASGSAGNATNSGSKSYDFGSDDILCSHEDYGNHDGNNGIHADHSVSAKEFNKSRMARSSVFQASTYSTPEESSFNQDVVFIVENTMKKYTDNIMRFLEGISSRLSQLELYCYNLDKSVGELRSDWTRDHGESESKLRSLDKHVQEVHRAVQILRDKQELVDTQKELAKLQLAQKESKQHSEERAPTPASEPKNSDNQPEYHDQQLALALPHQVAPPQPSLPARQVDHHQPSAAPQSSMAYGLPTQQVTNIPPPPQQPQAQYQDFSRMAAPQPSQPQPNMGPPQVPSLPPYQQQWAPQPVQPQQSVMPPQIRASSPMVYSSYMPAQSNQPPSEMPPSSMHVQLSSAPPSRPGSGGSDGLQYGYGAPARPIQQQTPPQQFKTGYAAQLPANTYMVFDGEPGRAHYPPQQTQFQQNIYRPAGNPSQNPPRVSQPMRGHPYGELIEKLVGMGYRSELILGVIQRLEESGQPIDFNAVLDRLNGHSAGPQRGW